MKNKELIYIYDWKQAYFYMENGLMPLERPGINFNTKTVYFVFKREDTKPLFDRWCTERW